MFTRRTVAGIVIGSIIIGIGAASLAMSFGLQEVRETQVIGPGSSLPYNIAGPAGAAQRMLITGDQFDITASGPPGAPSMDAKQHKERLLLEWAHEESGRADIRVRNTGPSDVTIEGSFNVSTDPILFAYHFVVITAGVIIIGFSLGFSVRRPRGF